MSSPLERKTSRLSADVKLLKQIEANIVQNYAFANLAVLTEVDTSNRYVEGVLVPRSKKKQLAMPNQFEDIFIGRRMKAYAPMAFTLAPTIPAPLDAWTLSVGSLVLVTFLDNDYREFLNKVVAGEITLHPDGNYPATTNEAHHTNQLGVITLKITDLTT